MHSAAQYSFQREMGQGKLDIFIENTSDLELAEVFASLQKLLSGDGACGHKPPAWYKRAEFNARAQILFLLLKKGILSPLGISRAVSAVPLP